MFVTMYVEVEPNLHPLNNETFQYKITPRMVLDWTFLWIAFWVAVLKCFTKIRVFNVLAVDPAFNLNTNLQKRELMSHVSTKWSTLPLNLQCSLQLEEWVLKLPFFYKRLASLLPEKLEEILWVCFGLAQMSTLFLLATFSHTLYQRSQVFTKACINLKFALVDLIQFEAQFSM